jgi:hypothetical protein
LRAIGIVLFQEEPRIGSKLTNRKMNQNEHPKTMTSEMKSGNEIKADLLTLGWVEQLKHKHTNKTEGTT